MVISVDIENVKEFVYSDKFRNFLLNATTDFGTAAFVLQTLTDKIDELKQAEEDAE